MGYVMVRFQGVQCGQCTVQAKKFDKAVTIMGRNQWWEKLNQVVGQLRGQDDAERTALRLSAAFFRRAGQTQFARETYVKLQDYQASMPITLITSQGTLVVVNNHIFKVSLVLQRLAQACFLCCT